MLAAAVEENLREVSRRGVETAGAKVELLSTGCTVDDALKVDVPWRGVENAKGSELVVAEGFRTGEETEIGAVVDDAGSVDVGDVRTDLVVDDSYSGDERIGETPLLWLDGDASGCEVEMDERALVASLELDDCCSTVDDCGGS